MDLIQSMENSMIPNNNKNINSTEHHYKESTEKTLIKNYRLLMYTVNPLFKIIQNLFLKV